MGTHVWFEETVGSELGTCPMCLQRGVVDDLCGACSVLPTGSCPECYEDGLEGVICGECGVAFEGEAMDGHCANCGEMGPCGSLCGNCEDTGSIYE
jgi:hypothetical protein